MSAKFTTYTDAKIYISNAGVTDWEWGGDAAADVLRIGRASATVGEVIGALTEAVTHRPDVDGELSAVTQLRLSEAEHRMLKARAAEAGLGLADYARRVLITYSAL